MKNKGDWWPPNWEKKLDGSFKNLAGPDYKHKNDSDRAVWLSSKSGASKVPNWFVCPFSGKDSNELAMVGEANPRPHVTTNGGQVRRGSSPSSG